MFATVLHLVRSVSYSVGPLKGKIHDYAQLKTIIIFCGPIINEKNSRTHALHMLKEWKNAPSFSS